MIRQLGHRYWPCFHSCITRVDIKPQANDRLASCKFISEFIDGTDDHPAMFTPSIRAWLSPPELPYVRSLLALSSESCFRVACSPRFLADYGILPRSSRQIEAIGEKRVEGRQRTRRVCAGYRFPAAMSQRCFSVRTVIASLAGPAFSIGLPQPPRQEHAIAVDLWPSRDRQSLNHALSFCRTQQCGPWFESTATLPPMARRPPRRQNSVESGNVRSFGRQVTARTG
jgi:hypothetical protein